MPHPGLLHPEPLPLRQATADQYLCRRHTDTVLSQSLWGLWILVHTRFVWALWESLEGNGFESKCDFASPTILLALLLCPWTWGISSKSPQDHAAATPAPATLLGLVCLWTWGICPNLISANGGRWRLGGWRRKKKILLASYCAFLVPAICV